MAEIQNDQTDIQPLDDEALEEVAGGSSGTCCSCSNCSVSQPPAEDVIVVTAPRREA